MTTKISFLRFGKGIGATTTILTVAHLLSEYGKRVIIRDFSDQADATTFLLPEGAFTKDASTIAGIIRRGLRAPAACYKTKYEGIHVMPLKREDEQLEDRDFFDLSRRDLNFIKALEKELHPNFILDDLPDMGPLEGTLHGNYALVSISTSKYTIVFLNGDEMIEQAISDSQALKSLTDFKPLEGAKCLGYIFLKSKPYFDGHDSIMRRTEEVLKKEGIDLIGSIEANDAISSIFRSGHLPTEPQYREFRKLDPAPYEKIALKLLN